MAEERAKKTKSPQSTPKEKKTDMRGKNKPEGYKPANGFKSLKEWDAEHTPAGENSRYIRNAMIIAGLPPIDISDEKQVEDRIMWYFGHCADEDVKPTVIGMCNALGIDTTTITSWKREEYRARTHSPVIKKAYGILHALWQDYMQNGKINPVSGIFLGTNIFEYHNTNDVVVRPEPADQTVPQEVLEERYRDAIGDGAIDTTATEVEK